MRKAIFVAALGVAALLLNPGESSAQRRGGGGGGRGWNGGGRGWDGGGRGWDRGGWYGGVGIGIYGDGWYGGYGYATPSNYSDPSYYYSPTQSGEEASEISGAAKRALIMAQVPANAQLFFEGEQTNQTGSMRTFVSPPLTADKTYTYDVRARWTDSSGKAVERNRKVTVQAGRRTFIDFANANAPSDTNNERLSNPNRENERLSNPNRSNTPGTISPPKNYNPDSKPPKD